MTQDDCLRLHQRVVYQQKCLDIDRLCDEFCKERQAQLARLEGLLGRREVPLALLPNDDRRRAGVTLNAQPSQKTELVPIRLDLDMDGYKLRDSLTWNLHEETLSHEEFAELTCRDFDLPARTFVPAIVKTIKEQLAEHREALVMLRNAGGLSVLVGIRAILRLDITIGLLQLTDRLEWDLGEDRNSPASFAADYVRELALPAEFAAAIATDIMEQVAHLRRALLLVGFTRDPSHGGAVRVNDPDLQALILAPITVGQARRDPNSLNDFTPVITELDALEMEKIELSRDREARRKRRQTRGSVRKTAASHQTLDVATSVSMANWTRVEPPKTMPTPLSYRGSLHRILTGIEDDEAGETPSTRSTSRRKSARK